MDQIATDIGSRLRQAREARGLTLRDLAATTKISMTALVAMEHNDFARLPGGLFRKAYVKSFAAEVGLNADELAREYCARFETEPAEPILLHAGGWKHAITITIVGLVICGLLMLQCGQAQRGTDSADMMKAPITRLAPSGYDCHPSGPS
jgi:transcriptional regulator with XRE-family HTH domain